MTTSTRLRHLALPFFLATASQLTACPDPRTDSTTCDPGETQSCICPGADGSQTCAPSGDFWESCECPDGDADSGPGDADADEGEADSNPNDGEADSGPPPEDGVCAEDPAWQGAWQGQIGPGCGLHPTFEAWVDALAFFWSTQPAFVCQAEFTQTSCLGQRFDGYWFDPGDSAILLINGTTNTLNAIAPGASTVSLAHEWGHVNQLALGQITGCLPTAPLTPLELELEADCFSGFAMSYFEDGQLYDSASTLYATGCGAADPTHGTCEQRWCAFTGGYQGAIDNAEGACVDPLGVAADVCSAVVATCA